MAKPKPYDENVDKVPRRYVWFKWAALPYAIFVTATLIALVWWHGYADRRLAAVKAEIAAAGEPVELSQLVDKPLPPDQNALAICRRLGGQVERIANDINQRLKVAKPKGTRPVDEMLSESLSKWLNIGNAHDILADALDPRVRAAHAGECTELMDAIRPLLAELRASRDVRGVDWGLDPERPMEAVIGYSRLKSLTGAAVFAAILAHEAGDDHEAIECLMDADSVGRRLCGSPSLIGHLVVLACQAKVVRGLECVLPTLRLGEEPGAASRKQVRALAASLLCERALTDGVYRAWCGERCVMTGLLENMRTGKTTVFEMVKDVDGAQSGSAPRSPAARSEVPNAAAMLVLGPLVTINEAELMEVETALVKVAREREYEAVKPWLGPPQFVDEPLAVGHMFSRVLMPSAGRFTVLHFRVLAQSRLAACGLACRLYEIDHGKLPERLEQLVSDYLPAVPTDPFGHDGAAIRYIANERPRVYSINNKQRDAGGICQKDGSSSEEDDLLLFLKGDRPLPRRFEPASGPVSLPVQQIPPMPEPPGGRRD